MWHRIFCRSDRSVSHTSLLEHLAGRGFSVDGHFRGDDLGWAAGKIQFGVGSPLYLERYLASEDGLRDDLNSWAGFLETCDYSPNCTMLMERVIQTAQLITLRKPIDHADEISLDRLCEVICQFVASTCDGVYQIDDQGWFAADGSLLLTEY